MWWVGGCRKRGVKKSCPNLSAMYLTVKEEQCGQKNEDGQEWAGEEYPVDELSMIDIAHILPHWTHTWHTTAIQWKHAGWLNESPVAG